MKNILEEIVAYKRLEVEKDKLALTLVQLKAQLANNVLPKHNSLVQALEISESGIISEFKRKSPSLSWIKREAKPEDIIPKYQQNGAAALSVLTDEHYFGGTLDYIRKIRPLINIPILRKDFIIDEYQIYQAKEAGADAILLIAACLSKEECKKLALKAKELELDVLLEVHNKKEIDHYCEGVTVVGVNNRNLETFITDIQNSVDLYPYLPKDAVKISESGLHTVEELKKLRVIGYKGFLMGERFMKTEDPGRTLKELINQLGK